jgi:hypothetical protein
MNSATMIGVTVELTQHAVVHVCVLCYTSAVVTVHWVQGLSQACPLGFSLSRRV